MLLLSIIISVLITSVFVTFIVLISQMDRENEFKNIERKSNVTSKTKLKPKHLAHLMLIVLTIASAASWTWVIYEMV